MRHSLIITLLIAAFGLTACSQQQENLPVSASAASETSAAVEQIANAASDAANDKSDESEIALYYQQPDPELKRARSVLHRFFNSPYAQKESALFNLSVWGAQILARHPEQTMAWCQELRTRHPNRLLAPLFKIAATPDSGKCLSQLDLTTEERQAYAEDYFTVGDILNMPYMPATLDARWVSFFATGKAEYIYGIVDYVADNAKIEDKQHQPEAGDDILTYGAARWSLGSNMKQYPQIKALVEKYTAGWPSERQQALQRALNPGQQ